MRKRMERINGTDMGIKYGTDGDKMRPFNTQRRSAYYS